MVRRNQLPVDVRRVRELGTERPVVGVPDGNCAVSNGCRKETLLRKRTRGLQIAGDRGGCGVSANEYSCAHHVTWGPSKLWRSTPPYLTYERDHTELLSTPNIKVHLEFFILSYLI